MTDRLQMTGRRQVTTDRKVRLLFPDPTGRRQVTADRKLRLLIPDPAGRLRVPNPLNLPVR